jgi:hypothetical protein
MGLKPSLRFIVDRNDAADLGQAARRSSLGFASKDVWLRKRGGTWANIVDADGDFISTMAVITRQTSAEHLLETEQADAQSAGALLGYPACCVRAVARHDAAGALWPLQFLSGLSPVHKIDSRLNRMAAEWGGVGLLGELFPCSPDCQAALMYGQSLYQSALDLGLRRLAEKARADAIKPVFILADGSITLQNHPDAKTVDFVDNI